MYVGVCFPLSDMSKVFSLLCLREDVGVTFK